MLDEKVHDFRLVPIVCSIERHIAVLIFCIYICTFSYE